MIDIQKILQHLPHRYPFLLVDRVLEVKPNDCIKALKNVTINEPFFTGHFPEHPVMPGVLILEALVQTAGILSLESVPLKKGHAPMFYFAGIDDARFKRVVIPGDQLIMNMRVIKEKRNIWKFEAEALVDGELACSAKLIAARKDEPK